MDPISILSIVGSALSVANGVTKAIGTLSELKSRYRNVPLHISTLIGQLYIVKAALEQVSLWSSRGLFSNARYQQLAAQIGTSLDSFRPLILALQQHLEEFDSHEDITVAPMKKVSFLWNEQELMAYSSLLDCQVNALSLFLQAVQCNTLADQRNLVNEEDSQTVLQKAKEYSASIVGLSDRISILSDCTNTHTLGLEFDFDASLLGSQAYRTAHRSNLRQLTNISKAPKPRYSAVDGSQQHHLPLSQASLAVPSASAEISDSFLSLFDESENPSHHNESKQIIKKPRQFSMIGSDWINDETFRSPHTSQERAMAPIGADKAFAIGRPVAESPRKKNSASTVSSPSSTLENTAVIPKVTLFRPLRKYLRARSTNQATNGNEAWDLLDVKRTKIHPSSTWTPVKKQEIKILILGSFESGKTTLLKDMRLFTGAAYTHEERACFAEINRTSIFRSMQVMLEAMESLNIPLQNKDNEHHVRNIFQQALQSKEGHPAEKVTAVVELWADAGVQEAFRRRHEYYLTDSVSYFAENVQRVTAAGYVPSQEDILRSRVKTTGVTETSIHLGDKILRVINVGGVRSERKKWIHAFEQVPDSIVFTVDASAYCKLLFEDERVNRMQEDLELWENIANSRWFTRTNFVLVFTKVDTLQETIELSPIAKYFPDFQQSIENCDTAQLIDSYLAYLKQRFISLMEQERARQQTQVVFADLVHINDQNPAGIVLENLKARSVARTWES